MNVDTSRQPQNRSKAAQVFEEAREAVVTALRTGSNPVEEAFGPQAEENGAYNAWSTLHDLLTTRDELSRRMAHAADTFTDAERYIRGEASYFNSGGILQAEGPAIDVLCAKFALQLDAAIAAEAFYRKQTP